MLYSHSYYMHVPCFHNQDGICDIQPEGEARGHTNRVYLLKYGRTSRKDAKMVFVSPRKDENGCNASVRHKRETEILLHLQDVKVSVL